MFPKSTHETFAQKMYQTYKGHKRFKKPKLARTDFTVNHYAGDVRTFLKASIMKITILDSLHVDLSTGDIPNRPFS